MRDVLILGGYGTFGKRIAAALARDGVPVIVAGRHQDKAADLCAELRAANPGGRIKPLAVDAERALDGPLEALKPAVVINTCGPFQEKDYKIAEHCLRHKTDYIDLADGRSFVTGISRLNEAAKKAGVAVISGASTVPGLSSAVIERYRGEFSVIEELRYGISPGQKAERGLATTQGILSYVGRQLKPAPGETAPRYGWQDIYRQAYPDLGRRWMANCDIPDLDLLPPHYGIGAIRFSAGLEATVPHLGLWALGWLVRLGMPLNLPAHAEFLLAMSHKFNRFGTDEGGMHVILRGKNPQGAPCERRWFIVAKNGDGPQIPCVPAIVLAKRIVQGAPPPAGAYPCLGLVSLADYLAELSRYAITAHEETA
jgi:hypothetical protein